MKKSKFVYLMSVPVLVAGIIGCGTVAKANSTNQSTATTSTSSTSLSEVSKLLPKGATIIPQGAAKVLSVDMNNDKKTEYVVLYKYQKPGIKVSFAGALIFTNENGKVQKLWQYTNSDVVTPASISVKDLLDNGKQEVIFKGQIGAMANRNEILMDNGGRIEPIFNSANYRLDIGNFSGSGSAELATWTQDVGDLYNIQVYGWNNSSNQYQSIPNTKAPSYFKNTVIPYYTSLSKTKDGKEQLRGIDYELATAYYDAGENKQALTEVSNGLKVTGYPPTSNFQALKNQIEH